MFKGYMENWVNNGKVVMCHAVIGLLAVMKFSAKSILSIYQSFKNKIRMTY